MPHVSPQKLDEKMLEKLRALFNKSLTSRDIPTWEHQAFFNEILTKTEKLMIVKRIAAISLLSQGASTYYVSKNLRLSETTTNEMLNKIENGRYKHTVKLCAIRRKTPLQRHLESILTMMPKYGTSPASVIREMLEN